MLDSQILIIIWMTFSFICILVNSDFNNVHTQLISMNNTDCYDKLEEVYVQNTDELVSGRNPATCYMAKLQILKYSNEEFLSELENIDKNIGVRRLHINILEKEEYLNSQIGLTIDKFLTPRLWWSILKENYYGKHGHHETHIFLLRYHVNFEPHLVFTSKLQYPESLKNCEESQLALGRFIDTGYGTAMIFYQQQVGSRAYEIFDIWDSHKNTLEDDVQYCNSTQCSEINKRLCAFLPLTSCPTPDELLTFIGSDLNKNVPENSIQKFTSASKYGKVIHQDNIPEVRSDYYWRMKKAYSNHDPEHFVAGPFYQLNRLRGDSNSDDVPWSTYRPIPRQNLGGYGLVFRINYAYRTMIYQKIHDMMLQQLPSHHHSKSNGGKLECTVIHIRRGDRTDHGRDICVNHTRSGAKQPYTCSPLNGVKEVSCHTLLDSGCFHERSYGSLSLQDYLDKAEFIHPMHSKTVFVLTDDGEWLEQQKQSLSPDWNVMVIPSKRYSKDHTANGVEMVSNK